MDADETGIDCGGSECAICGYIGRTIIFSVYQGYPAFVDWAAGTIPLPNSGEFMLIDGVYYYVNFAEPSFWSGPDYNCAYLSNVDQDTGLPVGSTPALSAYVGEEVFYYPLFPGGTENCGPESPGIVSAGNSPSINNLGEIVWIENDPVTGLDQIYSNIRGQLTSDIFDHWTPSINDSGEVVWIQIDPITGGRNQVFSSTRGQLTFDLYINMMPDINDKGEVIWVHYDQFGYKQIYSSERGQLTFDMIYSREWPSINNYGDIVWIDSFSGSIFGIIDGANVQITSGTDINSVSINDYGEVVWDEQGRIYSNQRGQLTDDCPVDSHLNADSNNCGDIVFKSMNGAYDRVYLLGDGLACGNPLDEDLDGDTYPLSNDCNDRDSSINPGVAEIPYNEIDENCNGMIDDDDLDGDTYPLSDDCNDFNPSINPGATEIPYNGVDENCNGMADNDDLDGDTYLLSNDCNDNDPVINPGAAEIKHDGVDQDCNGHDLTINIIKAVYKANRDRLKVEATSSLEGSANLKLSGFGPMIWKSGNSRWVITVNSAGGDPGTVSVAGIEGAESAQTTRR
jgi:hypothetical protein